MLEELTFCWNRIVGDYGADTESGDKGVAQVFNTL
jgi:hypothetical protein